MVDKNNTQKYEKHMHDLDYFTAHLFSYDENEQ